MTSQRHGQPVVSAKDHHADGNDQQQGVELVHAPLEDDFVGQEGQARADGQHLAL